MKRLILMLILWPVLALPADTEIHDPTSDIDVEWDLLSGSDHYAALSDDSDINYDSLYENESIGLRDLLGFDDTAISDSTIDSVVYTTRLKGDLATNRIAILDSIPGQTLRQSSNLGGNTVWADSTRMYTTSPSGGAWTWTNIDDLVAGFILTAMGNKRTEAVSEIWFTVYYHEVAATAEDPDYVHSIKGAGKVQSVLGGSKIGGP